MFNFNVKICHEANCRHTSSRPPVFSVESCVSQAHCSVKKISNEQLLKEIVLLRLYLMADMKLSLENYLLFFLLYNLEIAKLMQRMRISATAMNEPPERKVEDLSTEPMSILDDTSVETRA